MRRLLFGVAVVIGCTPADERCREIHRQDLFAGVDQSAERDFWERLDTRLPAGGNADSLRKVMRAEDAVRLRDQSLANAKTAADSERVAGYYPLDGSDPERTAPPRPSDERW